MTTATKYVKAPIETSPSDGSGNFTALIHPFEIDLDRERVGNFVNLPTNLPLNFGHLNHPGLRGKDPGARVGTVTVIIDEDIPALRLAGRLDLKKKMGQAVYERMLLPRDDPDSLNEFSIGFTYNQQKSYKGDRGERVLVDVELVEVSVVWQGAQRTELLAIKARRSDNETEKKVKASKVLRMVDDVQHDDKRYVSGLYHEIGKAMRTEIDDPDSDAADVASAAQAVLDRHIRQNRWRKEDDARRAKWSTYELKKALDSIDADLAVGEKAGHQLPNELDLAAMRRHLESRHANQIVSVRDVRRMQLDELVATHRVMHGMSKAADDLIADVKREKAVDDAARAKFEEANANLLAGPIDWAAQDAYDRARAARERQELEAKWREREQLADQREAAEIARHNEALKHGQFAEWTDTPVMDLDERRLERLEPRIDDQTVPDVGTRFTAPVSGTPDSTPLRLEPEDAVREVQPESDETYRVIPFAVTDTPQTVPQAPEESFRIYANQPEDAKRLETETPIPEVPEVGETFRLPTGGEATETPKDGESV